MSLIERPHVGIVGYLIYIALEQLDRRWPPEGGSAVVSLIMKVIKS